MSSITASIVVYNNSLSDIQRTLTALEVSHNVVSWIVVDNGASEEIEQFVRGTRGLYFRTGRNLGFGAAHNIALRKLSTLHAVFHLILNPDIEFDGRILDRLVEVMNARPEVGLIMPKVCYPNGEVQHLCKLLPAPIDLVSRRFLPGSMKKVAEKRIAAYELRELNYDTPARVPVLSGCFMFIRRSVLDAVGGFDERFFLYMEDVDLCRRISAISSLLYFPEVSVIHGYQMGSYRNIRLLWLHVRSAIAYFNKWGWIRDASRREINEGMLSSLKSKIP